MKKIKTFTLLLIILTFLGCEDYLTEPPLDQITDTPAFWNNEDNISTVAIGLYSQYFPGWKTGWSRTDWFAETNIADWNDDNAQNKATFFTKVAPSSGGAWSFRNLRRVNILIDRVEKATELTEEAKNHWLGVGRLFRALEYAKLVSRFGDMPWYDKPLESDNVKELYQARQPRTIVMDNVLKDLEFANKNLRKSDGTNKLTVNRDVSLAFTTRVMLFEGTWQKYREKNTKAAKRYLEVVKDAAEILIKEGKYNLTPNYKDLTTSEDLSKNKEIIIYREYVASIVTHSLMSFQNTESQGSSPSRSLIESYLTANGLPIHQSGNSMYGGDEWFFDEIKNRDPRLYDVIDTTGIRLQGAYPIYAASGYYANRFTNESLANKPGGVSSTNITDAPVMKFNEVLLNYIEAAAELSELGAYTLTQDDFDKTINEIRGRASVKMPRITLAGDNILVNGITIDDPVRSSDISTIIWEIRRERRIELAYEGIRFNDLRRWSKLEYADMVRNTKLNLGAWIDKNKYVSWYNNKFKPKKPITLKSLDNIKLDRSGNEGYIKPITDKNFMRTYSEKDYLYPIPLDQINLYESKGGSLIQNAGW